MYIVMVAAECAPAAKVGGLGDVISGLSRELVRQGHTVDVILPKYDCMQYGHIADLAPSLPDLWVPWGNGRVHTSVETGLVQGQRCFFIDPHSPEHFFSRGSYYGFADDDLRFSFFSKAALEYLRESGKTPDIVHTHDWQTALLPVLLYEIYRYHGLHHPRVCHTIHNFRHQGLVGERVLWASGLARPSYYFDRQRLEDDFNPAALNLLKGAIVYSDFVTTVSPHHAWEVRHTGQGMGLGGVLDTFQHKFGGILNGLDAEMWNPSTDPIIPRRYSVENIDAKYENKAALRERLRLRDGYKPIFAYVGRLDTQKGIPLIRHALYYALANGAQFVLLGTSPEHAINAHFSEIQHSLSDNRDLHIELAFDEDLSRLIYAGSDLSIVPSMYEPCGLTQLIALRYGTVPIVRAVGGLTNTVFDRDYGSEPEEQRNGYVFQHADPSGIESALVRALGLWNLYPREFRKLIEHGMRQDFSWSRSAQHYVDIYEYVRAR